MLEPAIVEFMTHPNIRGIITLEYASSTIAPGRTSIMWTYISALCLYSLVLPRQGSKLQVVGIKGGEW